MSTPNSSAGAGIGSYDYSAWPLEKKLEWIASGSGGSGGDAAKGALLNLGDSFALTDTNIRQALEGVGIEWEGSAAQNAGAAMARAAQHSADISDAHAVGSSSLTAYGQSFDGMKAYIGRMAPPAETFWGSLGDHTIGIFGFQSDHAVWEEEKARNNAEADVALKAHEQATRDAVNQFPELTPAPPTTTDPARNDPGVGRAASGVSVHDPGAGPAVTGGGVPGDQVGGPGGADGGAGGAAPTIPTHSGADGPRGGPTGSAVAGLGTPSPIPSLGGASTSTAGHTPAQMPIRQAPDPSIPGWSAGPSGPGSPSPGSPYGSVPYGSVPYGAGASGPSGSGSGGPGRRVSTGPEFGAKLPSAGGLPGSVVGDGVRGPRAGTAEPGAVGGRVGAGSGAAGSGTAASGAGAGDGMGTPMTGGGAGGSDRTRRARYVIPSSAAFEPPLPPHVDGVLGPEDEDHHPR